MKSRIGSQWMVVAGLLAATVGSRTAQAQGAAAPSAKLVGSWSGSYVTDGPSGPMTLTISRTGASWKIVDALEAAPPAGDIREIMAEGDKITWKQMFGEYDVTFSATLSADGASLTGKLDASQGGASAGGGTFTLTKK